MILLWVKSSPITEFLYYAYNIFLVIFILICYLLRDLPVFGWFWGWIKLIFLGIFITLVAGFFKKSIKEWWND
jgi:ABC-type multidrug transport system permease subunit